MKIAYTLGFALAITCITRPAAAQFTAAVVPPERVVVVDTTTQQDSVRKARAALQERISDLKAWVDSAAVSLSSLPDSMRRDSTAARPESVTVGRLGDSSHSVTTVASGEVEDGRTGTTSFRAGAAAPETATPLPAFALVGGMLLGTGLLLLKR